MADNILRVGAEFDASPLIAGAQQAGVAFDSVKAKLTTLAAEFESAGNTTASQAARFMATGMTANEAASALQNLGSSAKTAAEATAAVGAAAGIAAPELQKVAAAAVEAESSAGKMVSAYSAARVEMGALTGSTGAMAYGLARVAAQSSSLAPLIQAAFPVVAALALVDILKVIGESYDKLIESVAGWDEAAKKAYDEQVKQNIKMMVSTVELQNEVRNLNQIGAQGMEKFSIAAKDNAANLHNLGAVSAELARALAADNAELEKLHSWGNKVALAFELGWADPKYTERVKQLTSDIAALNSEIATLDAKQRQLQTVEPAKIHGDAAAEARKEQEARTTAQIEAEKAIGVAREQAAVQAAEGMRSLQRLTADQEAELLLGAEQRKYAIERKAQEETVALLRTQGSEKKAEIDRINGQMEADEIAHNSRMQAIRDKADSEDQKAFQSMARGLAEDFLRSLEEKARAFEQEQKQELEAQLKGFEGQLNAAKEAARIQEEVDKTLYDEKEISFKNYVARSISEANELYNRQIEIYSQEADAVREKVAKQVLTEAEGSVKLKEIWNAEQAAFNAAALKMTQEQDAAAKKQEQIIRQITTNMTNTFAHAFSEVLTGHERLAQAMSQVWDKMATTAAENIAKMVEQEAIALATHKTAAMSEILIDAKTAAADAYKAMAGIPVIGPELGAAAAAATFAAVIAFGSFQQGGVIGAPSGQAVPIIAHGGESVLPEHLTNFLMNAASTTTNNSTRSSVTNNFHQNPTINVHQRGGSMGPGEIVKAVRRGIRMGH